MLRENRVQPRDRLINACVTEDERETIHQAAKNRGISTSSLIRRALREKLTREKGDEAELGGEVEERL